MNTAIAVKLKTHEAHRAPGRDRAVPAGRYADRAGLPAGGPTPRPRIGRGRTHLWVSVALAGAFLLGFAGVVHAGPEVPDRVMAQVSPDRHDEVQEILADPTFVAHLQMETDASPQVFIFLLDHPDINCALARALQIAPNRLWRVGPGRYQGDDGAWNSGTLEVLSAEGDRRVFLAHGVSHGWWFGDVAGRVVGAVDLASEADDHIRGEVQVWAKIDHGVLDRLLRVVAPVIGKLLDRQLEAQFGVTFRLAEHASHDTARFCHALAMIPDGSREERQTLASVAACPGVLD